MRLMMLEGRCGLLDGWIAALHLNGFDLDRFACLAEAEEALRQLDLHYAILLIDKDLRDGDGIDWLRSRRQALQMPLIIVAPDYDVEERIRALDAGADDVLPEGLDTRELVARLRALMRRQPLLRPDILSTGNVRIDLTCRQLFIAEQSVAIPRRELGILERLMRAFTRTLTREFLEASLYGATSDVSPNSVEVRISRLRRILYRHGANVEIQTVRGVGYRLQQNDITER
jgi:two-component system response regulator QseB